MTLHLKSRGYPFRPRLLFSSFIVVGVGFPTVYYFRRGQLEVRRFVYHQALCCLQKKLSLWYGDCFLLVSSSVVQGVEATRDFNERSKESEMITNQQY